MANVAGEEIVYKKESRLGMTTLTYRSKRYTFPSVIVKDEDNTDGMCILLDVGLFCPFCTGAFTAKFSGTQKRIAVTRSPDGTLKGRQVEGSTPGKATDPISAILEEQESSISVRHMEGNQLVEPYYRVTCVDSSGLSSCVHGRGDEALDSPDTGQARLESSHEGSPKPALPPKPAHLGKKRPALTRQKPVFKQPALKPRVTPRSDQPKVAPRSDQPKVASRSDQPRLTPRSPQPTASSKSWPSRIAPTSSTGSSRTAPSSSQPLTASKPNIPPTLVVKKHKAVRTRSATSEKAVYETEIIHQKCTETLSQTSARIAVCRAEENSRPPKPISSRSPRKPVTKTTGSKSNRKPTYKVTDVLSKEIHFSSQQFKDAKSLESVNVPESLEYKEVQKMDMDPDPDVSSPKRPCSMQVVESPVPAKMKKAVDRGEETVTVQVLEEKKKATVERVSRQTDRAEAVEVVPSRKKTVPAPVAIIPEPAVYEPFTTDRKEEVVKVSPGRKKTVPDQQSVLMAEAVVTDAFKDLFDEDTSCERLEKFIKVDDMKRIQVNSRQDSEDTKVPAKKKKVPTATLR